MPKRSQLELRFESLLKNHGFVGWVAEYRFAPPRRWLLDFAWIDLKLGIELDGGTWSKPREKPCELCGQKSIGQHARGIGIRAAAEKRNTAQLHGWKILVFTSDMVRDGTALQTLENIDPLLPRDTLREPSVSPP